VPLAAGSIKLPSRGTVGHEVQKLAGHAAVQGDDIVGADGVSERIGRDVSQLAYAIGQLALVEAEIAGGLGPRVAMKKYSVVAAELHREAKLAFVYAVRQCGSDVVERGDVDLVAGHQQRVVLGVRVGAADQPIPDKRIDKSPEGLFGHGRGHRLA
jgi:hypothetical protein